MSGTAIRHRPFGLMVRTRRFGAGRDRVGARSAATRGGARPALVLDVRAVLTALAVFALVFGAVVGPAAHQWLEGDVAASGKVLGKLANSSGGPDVPLKDKVLGYCSGHCATHAYSLPALVADIAPASRFETRWAVANDAWAPFARAARLERPPRV